MDWSTTYVSSAENNFSCPPGKYQMGNNPINK